MKIKSKSWHLRLVQMYDEFYVPRDLCSYFWVVAGAIVLSLFVLVAFTAFSLGIAILFINLKIGKKIKTSRTDEAIAFLSALLTLVLYSTIGFTIAFLLDGHLIYGIITVSSGIFLTCILWIFTILFIKHHFEHEQKEHTPNLLIEFIKAKKHKVCPLIEVIEDN